MSGGIMVSTNSGNVALSTTFTAVTLSFNVAAEGHSVRPIIPGMIHGWTLELDLNTLAGGAATIQRLITYNASATKGCAGLSTAAAMTTVTGAAGALATAEIPFSGNRPIYWPGTTYTAGGPTLTVWLKLDAGTANLSTNGARLHYTDSADG